MKIRNGFVSNSSSGSFIFPKEMTIEKVTILISDIEKFISKISGTPIYSGLTPPRIFTENDGKQRYWILEETMKDRNVNPEDYYGCVVVDTVSDNSCPYSIHQILKGDKIHARYFHHSG